MISSEFKAWFEGFTEGIEGAPTKKQFERIKEKVAKIDGAPITQPVYVRDYWYPHIRYFGGGPFPYTVSNLMGVGQNVGMQSAMGQASGITSGSVMQLQAQQEGPDFDSHRAMYALGKEEFAA